MPVAVAKPWFPIVEEEQTARERIDGVVAGEFLFNGELHRLGRHFDWLANPSADIEWLILLHKFYYATGLGIAWQETGRSCYLNRWCELIDSWIDSVPLDFLPSDVTGRRIQQWISSWYFFEDAVNSSFRQRFLDSLEQQLDWLLDHLTPARNHRTLELLALFLGAIALPARPASRRWLRVATQEIVRNLETDFRPDGVHIEQSTDYHHIVLRNALIVKRLADRNGIAMPAAFDTQIRRALEFALWIHRPDGNIPSLSDGDTASFLDLLRQGYELYRDRRYLWAASAGLEGAPPLQTQAAFPDGGYYVWRSGWGLAEPFRDERYLVFDCGPLGEGNHGHLDWLSFELFGYGQPLIVDPGRYTYSDLGGWRARFRGSAYHNTVTVGESNQCRYEPKNGKWKIRQPHALFEMLIAAPGVFRGRVISPCYDAVHEREIRVAGTRRFAVIDELTSPTVYNYDLWFHLSPAAHNRVELDGSRISAPHLRIVSNAACRVEQGWVSPTYGVKHPAPVVRYSATGGNVRFETHIEVFS